MIARRLCCVMTCWLGGIAPTVVAQVEEHRDVIQLRAEDVGPYRPEERPALDRVEQLIVEQTNQFRRQQSREPLKQDETLHKTAQAFAEYMAKTDLYGHHADGRGPAQRAQANEYSLCQIAENIAYFFATEGFETQELAKQAVDGWINSPGHRRNMLKQYVTETGVGVAQSEQTGVFYAVQMFGQPKSKAISFQIQNSSGESIRYKLGDREYTLPSRYTRTHQMCVPEDLALLKGEEKSPTQTPADGNHFVVEQDGSLSLKSP